MRSIRVLPVLLLLIACGLPAVYGQSLAGLSALSGTVSDPTGSLIADAEVTVANPSLGITRRLTSNDSGYFSAGSLPPGKGYEVTVSRTGFANFEAKDLILEVGQNVVLRVPLGLAASTQTITVMDATPIVDQAKTGVSQVINSAQILNLPINGRRVDSFVLLSPGVVADGTFGAISFRGMPSGNAFLQDGNDTTLQFYNENAGRTRISSNISQDSVQEFQVQSSGYSAEFGRAVGGVINTVTKSGTNQVHGTGYWFFRNRTLNARDRYAPFNPAEYRHQAGGSIGGPIRKDKLFYFFNTDFTRRNFPLISSILNPQFFNAGGTFIGACGAPATPAQCSSAVDYFRRFFGTIDRTAAQNLYFGKLDWRPDDRNSVSASFNLLNWDSPNGIQTAAALTNAGAIGNNGLSTVKTRWARLAHTLVVSPAMLNEFRFGWYKDRLFDDVNYTLAPPGVRTAVTVAGQANLGVPNYLPRVQPTEDRFQFADNLSWTSGRHQFKFGFDIAHTRDTENALFNGTGSYTYGSITDFAQDLTNLDGGKRWQNYSQAFGPLETKIFIRDYNFYAQDQWRITNRLTLNYGVRYEYAQFKQPTVANPDYPQTGRINQPGKNFAPRFGFAYAFNNTKTVIRGGYGIMYARFPSATIARLHQLNGVVQKSLTLQGATPADRNVGPVFPARLVGLDRNPPTGTVTVVFADPNLATPYTQQADFGIEHQITRDVSLTVSYLWNRAVKSITRRDLNIGREAPDFTYRINDTAGNQVATYTTPTYILANRVDPRYSRVVLADNGGRIWYDGLALQLRRRASKWAEGSVAYTWSHARDLNQGGASNNVFFSDAPATLFNGNYSLEKGTSTLDQRHRAVLTGLIAPPAWKFGSAAARTLANGWQLSFIATVASAQYATPSILVTGAQFPGQAFNNSLNGFGGSSQAPFLTRQSIPIDAIQRVDSRITKAFSIKERTTLMLNFEVFNTFNRVSNTSVNTTAYNARAGVLTPVAGLGTGTASGGFPDGTNARRAQVSMRVIF